jgi:glucose/arabinose dehydrogenase
VADGFSQPIYVTHAGDGSGRLFIVEQAGKVWILDEGSVLPDPFLDIDSKILSGGERGLLGLAFSPNYKTNGHFFVHYSDLVGDTALARYTVSADPNRADPNSEVIILQQDQPFSNHNGGQIAFGPDGYLYMALGDGGSGGDPLGNGQNKNTLLGKLLRLDVSGSLPYLVPPDNPFAGGGGRPEVWAWGLRNPWRFSFDRLAGDLYIADVGQNAWEEINFQPAGSAGGANYGWNFMEGGHCYPSPGCDPTPFVAPVAEYSHAEGCSVTGGYVYRGGQATGLYGAYLYGDYCSGKVWGLLKKSDGTWANALLLRTDAYISSFGEDEAGEVYILDHNGPIYRLRQR